MSEVLYKMFCEKFPPIGSVSRISVYPLDSGGTLIERIYLNLLDESFIEVEEPLTDSDSIKKLAGKIFDDVEFDFYKHSEEGNIIFFNPEGVDDYSQNYSGHYIAVREPLKIPVITISTGNRGAIKLNSRQRDKYFYFVCELYDMFFWMVLDV
ncbi:MAG: hypothetical protein U9P44_01915 [archaeon]|nr:hypothetical protein [archaeon]